MNSIGLGSGLRYEAGGQHSQRECKCVDVVYEGQVYLSAVYLLETSS